MTVLLLCFIFFLFLITAVAVLIFQNRSLRGQFNDACIFFNNLANIINSVRYGDLSARVDINTPEYTRNTAESINRMIETLNDRENMIVEYQAELTKQNDFLTALINSLYDGIFVLDEEFTVLRTNKKILEWLKIDDIKGANVFDFIKISENKDIRTLSDDEIFLKGNTNLYFKASTKKIEAEEHQNKYMIAVNNYTNQKEIESLKEDFVATLTHDLKVPIIAEANMLEFFLNGKFGALNEKQKEALNSMKSSNKELLDLVRIVLDTYKVKEGEIELNKESVSIKSMLNDTADEMNAIALKSGNNIVIKTGSDFSANIDYLQFKRVIKNLVNNAILYGIPDTDIELAAKKENDKIQITVKDYGNGISKEDADKIFNRYFSASKKFRKIGTGLGLYLSEKIVGAHGGKLTVSSKEGEYTEFCISLPADGALKPV